VMVCISDKLGFNHLHDRQEGCWILRSVFRPRSSVVITTYLLSQAYRLPYHTRGQEGKPGIGDSRLLWDG
jgi:hypothetical protein